MHSTENNLKVQWQNSNWYKKRTTDYRPVTNRNKNIQTCFEQRCNKICDIFEKYSYEYEWITNFKLLGDEVHGWGLCSKHGYVDDVECYFPVDYLFMSDEELQNIVDERINERNEKECIKQEKKKRVQEEKERQMYEALKQKYDGPETDNNVRSKIPVNIVKRSK